MRILVVGQFYPWPSDSGSRLRLANIIEALLLLGDVELFVATRDPDHPEEVPADERFTRTAVARVRRAAVTVPRRLAWWARPREPLELLSRDASEVPSAFRAFTKGARYDLIWVSRMETLASLGATPDAPTIVDIDDLRDDLNTSRFDAYDSDGQRTGVVGALKQLQTRKNASLWGRFQREASRSADAVVVCSEADRKRLGVSNAAVIPNGYDDPDRPLGRVPVGDPPTILLQGLLKYPPNVDAAYYLVDRVMPLVRRTLPDARLRVVGEASPVALRLTGRDGVTLTGWVPEIEPELARADVVAVPIRYGGGTRIKILESFAHRIPVVSTSLGAYGLGVVDRKHLLVADDPERFAAACIELLTDQELRTSLTQAAHELFVAQYRWGDIAERIRELARTVVAQPREADMEETG